MVTRKHRILPASKGWIVATSTTNAKAKTFLRNIACLVVYSAVVGVTATTVIVLFLAGVSVAIWGESQLALFHPLVSSVLSGVQPWLMIVAGGAITVAAVFVQPLLEKFL